MPTEEQITRLVGGGYPSCKVSGSGSDDLGGFSSKIPKEVCTSYQGAVASEGVLGISLDYYDRGGDYCQM